MVCWSYLTMMSWVLVFHLLVGHQIILPSWGVLFSIQPFCNRAPAQFFLKTFGSEQQLHSRMHLQESDIDGEIWDFEPVGNWVEYNPSIQLLAHYCLLKESWKMNERYSSDTFCRIHFRFCSKHIAAKQKWAKYRVQENIQNIQKVESGYVNFTVER